VALPDKVDFNLRMHFYLLIHLFRGCRDQIKVSGISYLSNIHYNYLHILIEHFLAFVCLSEDIVSTRNVAKV
jgi:hypothetical protein